MTGRRQIAEALLAWVPWLDRTAYTLPERSGGVAGEGAAGRHRYSCSPAAAAPGNRP